MSHVMWSSDSPINEVTDCHCPAFGFESDINELYIQASSVVIDKVITMIDSVDVVDLDDIAADCN